MDGLYTHEGVCREVGLLQRVSWKGGSERDRSIFRISTVGR